MPYAETAAYALRAGALVLVEVGRRQYRKPWRTHDGVSPRHRPLPAVVEELVEELEDCAAVGVGPLVRGVNGMPAPVYFIVASSAAATGYFTLIGGAPDARMATDLRNAVIARLITERLALQTFRDEADLARWCGQQWPDDPIASKLVEVITAERMRG
jgi:hypothetical protein